MAKHFREFHYGENWTWSTLKDSLADLTWQQATTKIHSFNTIAALVYHIHYFVKVTKEVLEGGPLDWHDKFSFDHPRIESQEDWEKMLEKIRSDADRFADLIEQLPSEKLWETFSEEKYGNYYRNIQGVIEHSHYHLGQIVFLRKLIEKEGKS